MMNSQEIRNAFIDFFQEKDHRFIRSSPVVPIDDPTLLFTNAGMNQFKPIFLGQQEAEHLRVVNSQKCIRVSGKHNDLEEVGLDTFHHTFFEMLGNWSFGDYYKAEAIQWAWELFTEVWGLDKNRLWATVYHDDDEAFQLWPKVTDIDSSRVLKFDKKDNFWEMGETGPCGPCSEIHYFIGDDLNKQRSENVNVSDQYWELWNLVFIQNNRIKDGSLTDLPAKHVDTGAGLERIVSVLQNRTSNYATDLFMPIIQKVENLTGKSYQDNPVPFQVIADHIRMLSFSIADGCMPGNEGRGYVLRRILRRAARFGRMLDQHQPFIYNLIDIVGEIMGDFFPEVVEKRAHIEKVVKAEESSFNDTLDRGLIHFDKVLKNVSGNMISGVEAFRLYDTYGFPLDLTQLMAREKGLDVDEKGYIAEMDQQKKRAKASGKFVAEVDELKWKHVSKGKDSDFKGYETLSTDSQIRRYTHQNDHILVVLDKTPFYAESGGQIGDTGTIKGNGVELVVEDVTNNGGTSIHYCKGTIDEKAKGKVQCLVDSDHRQNIRKNHTATHLMHQALKLILGDHVHQAGSLVHPDYLRFDLTHFEKLTSDQIREIETMVNREILLNNALDISVKNFDEAKKQGAVAMFGEKYGDEVRVVTVADFSMELCGGTHVERTGDIGLFKITEESSLASGVRRIVAVTGPKAVEHIQKQAATLGNIQSQLNSGIDQVSERIDQLLAQKKKIEKELKRQKKSGTAFNAKSLVEKAKLVGDQSIVIQMTDAGSMDELKGYGDSLLTVLRSGVGVLGAEAEKPSVVVVVSQDLVKSGLKAGDLAELIGNEMGGGGGGKPHLATAGGQDAKGLKSAMAKSLSIIKKVIQE